MVVDAHYHLEERLELLDRLVSQMDRSGIDRVLLIAAVCQPFHVKGVAVLLSDMVRKLLTGRGKRLGRRLYASTVTERGTFSIVTDQYTIYSRPNNESVAAAVKAHPDKFRGWIFVNPAVSDPLPEIEKRRAEGLWIGVKAHPFWHRYPVRMLDDAAAFCAETGMPLLIHLGAGEADGDFRCLPDRHPGLRVIYAHAGIPFYDELWQYAKERSGVYVDLSAPFLDFRLRARTVAAVGAEHCLYGTDGPFGYPAADGLYNHAAILNEIRCLPVSDDAKAKILGGNICDIAGLG